MSDGSSPRLLIVVGQVLSEPWLSISREGQFSTWIPEAQECGVRVRHSHGNRSGPVVRVFDRWHEWLRWRGVGRSVVPRLDSWAGNFFLDTIPEVSIGQFLEDGHTAWHQNLTDVYACQRWKVVGSLAQALQEDFTHVYFTTASSYVRVSRLVEVVNSLPATRVYAGTRHVDSISGQTFASGANRILSRDVVELVVDQRRRYRNDVMEDVGLGRLISEVGVDLTELPSVNVSSLHELQRLDDAALLSNFHFRMTSGTRRSRQDAHLMKALHSRLQTISNSLRTRDA